MHHSPFDSYQKSYDILALRPQCTIETRRAAARYAESKVGAPYASSIPGILFGRSDETGYSCASLMWQAYKKQGLDLFPVPSWLDINVVPLALDHSTRLDVIGRGTRYRPIPTALRRLRAERCWFQRIIGANIFVDGA